MAGFNWRSREDRQELYQVIGILIASGALGWSIWGTKNSPPVPGTSAMNAEIVWRIIYLVALLSVALLYYFGKTASVSRPHRDSLIIHYAGWGRGPLKDAYIDVTEIMRGYINAGSVTEGVKATVAYFGHHYGGEPRRLRVDYSYGLHGKKLTAVIPEDHLVRLTTTASLAS
jgi:hypothetical protein